MHRRGLHRDVRNGRDVRRNSTSNFVSKNGDSLRSPNNLLAAVAAVGLCWWTLDRRLSNLEREIDGRVCIRWMRASNCTSMPMKATAGAAGYDLYAAQDESKTIPPHGRALISTGVILELPSGFEAQIRPRSGLALKYGITVLNAPGTVDADYRGVMKVLLSNTTDEPFIVVPGDRIAQLVVARTIDVELSEVDRISATARGESGFGSTGTL